MQNLIKHIYRNAAIVGATICIIIGATACQEKLSNVNKNPNTPTKATTPYLLTSGERQLASEYWGIFPMGYFGNLYSQYWSQTQYTEESRYQYRQAAVVNGMWDNYYEGMNTLQQIIRQNRSQPSQSAAYGPNADQIAVVQILKAWTFETLTDIYGNVPYTQALKGASNATPAYDSQQKIYASLIDTLESASNALTGQTAFTSGDVFYNGDAQKWKKFANSLIMRLAIREADAAPKAAKAAFQKAYQGGAGGFQSTDDDALFPFQSSPPYDNPVYDEYTIQNRDDWGVTNTLVDFMNKNNDPRIGKYAEPAINNSTTKYSGFPYGLNNGNAISYFSSGSWSRPTKRVRQATAPAIFMTYSEVKFDEAEAAQRGWISGDPATYYRDAIKASMNYWNVPADSASKYIKNHPYQPNNWRQNIGRQKWVALYMQGVQGWSVYRRLDFGLLTPPADGKKGSYDSETDTPVRLPYPNQEHDLNSANVKKAISAQGFSKDDQGQRLWWDKAAQNK